MVAGNTLLKFLFGQMLDQLREDGAARVHPSLVSPRRQAEGSQSGPFSIQIVPAPTIRHRACLQWVRVASRNFSRTAVMFYLFSSPSSFFCPTQPAPLSKPEFLQGACTRTSSECKRFGGRQSYHLFDSLSFGDGVNLVRSHVFETFRFSARPANLNQIDLVGRSQTEMKPQIVLRKIAASPAHFIELRHSSGMNGDARPDRRAIALGSHQTEEDAVVRDFIGVEQ